MSMNYTRVQGLSRISLLILAVVAMTASFAQAEELRLMTYQGNPSEEQVEKFEQLIKEKYGIDLNVTMTYVSDQTEYFKVLKNKQVDIINCPHNIPKDPRYKFIRGKLIIPVNLDNVPQYANLIPLFQKADHITEDGEVYGVPFIYAPYGLAYNTSLFPKPPASWNIFWEPEYAGKYAIGSDYEPNIYLTALSMGRDASQLGDYDAVSSPEFQEKLTALVKNAKVMWIGVDTADVLQGLAFSTAWGFSLAELKNRGEMWKIANPKEGTVGGIGYIMLSNTLRGKPQLKQLAEEFANFVISPEYQVNVVVRTLSSGPVNQTIKKQLTPEEVEAFHLNDPKYFKEQLIPYPILDSRSRKWFELLWKKATR